MGATAGGGEAPTQIFPRGAQAAPPAPAAAGTSPLGRDLGPMDFVAGQRPTEYQPVAGQQTTTLVGQPFGSQPLSVGAPPPAPRRRGGAWLFALLGVFVLGIIVASALYAFWPRTARRRTVVEVGPGGPPGIRVAPPPPEAPEVPADIGERVRAAMESLKGHGIPMPLDESGAVVSGRDTILTRTFALDSGASFSTHVASGNVTVVGSDDADEAVVKIVKRGGSVRERAAARVLAVESEEGVVLVGAAAPGGPVSVSYEITVPRRGLRRLELSAQKGDIKVSGFDGELELDVKDGNVSVNTGGGVRARVGSGKVRVDYVGEHEEAQEFSVTNGDVDLFVGGSGPSVDLRAASTNGKVEVHDFFGVKAEKRGAGQRLERRFGEGGGPLSVKVVNGDIRVRP